MSTQKTPSRLSRGFTLPEVMVVMGVIAVLLAVLLPALTGAMNTADMAKSQSRLKQIGHWMTLYSQENRDHIVPSQFNYQDPAIPGQPYANYPVKVRSHSGLGSLRYKGTWTDILWTYNDLGKTQALDNVVQDMYRFDSPDEKVYEANPGYDENPFRAAAVNRRPFMVTGVPGSGPKPFGTGASEESLPGYFAANNFFNADRDAPPLANPDPAMPATPTPANGRWYVNGQIKAPDRSMYLVDSLAGETIEAEPEPFDTITDTDGNGYPDYLEVDFRYNGDVCLMLFLDGHSTPEPTWDNLTDLQLNRNIRVQNLHLKTSQ